MTDAGICRHSALAMTEFAHGQLFETTFKTSEGDVGLLAEIAIEGRTLHLLDVVVEPIAVRKLRIGSRAVMAARSQLIEKVRAAGFAELRITGERLTGANAGRRVEFIMDLSE